mmetsp:Transcript_1437/g.1718  ORF Transcript_1437/g.1718 Transcript_1437/m.1718 type:complete len:98 (-) Transcript_1437:32-325(-)
MEVSVEDKLVRAPPALFFNSAKIGDGKNSIISFGVKMVFSSKNRCLSSSEAYWTLNLGANSFAAVYFIAADTMAPENNTCPYLSATSLPRKKDRKDA